MEFICFSGCSCIYSAIVPRSSGFQISSLWVRLAPTCHFLLSSSVNLRDAPRAGDPGIKEPRGSPAHRLVPRGSPSLGGREEAAPRCWCPMWVQASEREAADCAAPVGRVASPWDIGDCWRRSRT